MVGWKVQLSFYILRETQDQRGDRSRLSNDLESLVREKQLKRTVSRVPEMKQIQMVVEISSPVNWCPKWRWFEHIVYLMK